MQALLNVICSVTSFCVLSAVIISVIPPNARLKRSLGVLSGLVCLVLLLPLFKISISDFSIEQDSATVAVSDIEELINNRIADAVIAQITEVSTPILNKYGITYANATLDAQILDENGIFIRSVNYIVTDSLSSKSAVEAELTAATGYYCKIISKEEK